MRLGAPRSDATDTVPPSVGDDPAPVALDVFVDRLRRQLGNPPDDPP
jgi:hypothetical protein